MKKFLSLLLAAMMIFSVLPTAALADGMKTLDMAPVGEVTSPAEQPAAPAEEPAEAVTADVQASAANSDEVPAENRLSKLVFRMGMATSSYQYTIQPEFDPKIKEYTIVVADNATSVTGICVSATLADTASGKIVAVYTAKGKLVEKEIVSGKELATPLMNAIMASSIEGTSVTIKIGDIEAYKINVIRSATLKALTVKDQGGNALSLSPAFNKDKREYEIKDVAKGKEIIFAPTTTAKAATVTVNGKALDGGTVAIEPVWNEEMESAVKIIVSGEGAESNVYTVNLIQAEPEIESIEVVTPPEKTEYKFGEKFDASGISVKAHYKDGSSRSIRTDWLTFSPSEPLKLSDTEVEIEYKGAKTTQKISVISSFKGKGTEENPFLISSVSDFEKIRDEVAEGISFKGAYFEITNDISFTAEWVPIGNIKDGVTNTENGANIMPFSGTINGKGHTLTFEKGCKPLFNYVREAGVSNFNIVALFMDGFALVDKYTVDYGEDGSYGYGTGGSYAPGCPDTINIEKVVLKSGSIIKSGGFIGGFASGGNVVNMTDCVVEKGVKIGCNEDGTSAGNGWVGSFGGMISGTFKNCISYADVYGDKAVGGIIGYKGQSMGPFKVIGCKFYGNVYATGDFVGGIVGSGYASPSAPNSMCVVIEDCESTATIYGGDYVGGILGNESVVQCWDNGIGRIRNNLFRGKIIASGENVGGIVGRMVSLNRYTIVENNVYSSSCGFENGIGSVTYIDTSCTDHETASGTIYFNTAEQMPGIKGVAYNNHNREDDPLGADIEKLFRRDDDRIAAMNVEELIAAIGTVTKDSGEAIKAARDAYNALTEGQKALVSKEALDTLVKAEKIYDMIIASTKPGTAVGGKTDSSSSGVIKISATGAAKGEQNPNTGAPAMSVAPAMLMLTAAAFVLKKRG